MNLYKLAGAFAVLACIGILVFSYLSWQDKLQQAAGTNAEVSPETANAGDETSNAEDETETSKTESTTEESDDFVNIEDQLANMDDQVKQLFLDKQAEGEAVQMLIAGSEALESGEPGYAELLETEFEEAYGELVDVTIESVTGTSDSLKSLDLENDYDLVLLEPMTLMNNDRISIEDEREDVRDFTARLQEANTDAIVILHPPQPIFGAGYYLAQVQALGQFATLYGYPYINHWDAWPATDDPALQEHLTEDAVPNSKGAEVWASELIEYFIAN